MKKLAALALSALYCAPLLAGPANGGGYQVVFIEPTAVPALSPFSLGILALAMVVAALRIFKDR